MYRSRDAFYTHRVGMSICPVLHCTYHLSYSRATQHVVDRKCDGIDKAGQIM